MPTQELTASLPSRRRGGFGRQALQRSSAPADDYRPQWSAFERGGLEHHSASPAHYGGDSGGGPFAPSPEERMHQVQLAAGECKCNETKRRRSQLCMSLCDPLCVTVFPLSHFALVCHDCSKRRLNVVAC